MKIGFILERENRLWDPEAAEGAGTVRLTPGWSGNRRPQKSLNFFLMLGLLSVGLGIRD